MQPILVGHTVGSQHNTKHQQVILARAVTYLIVHLQ